MYETICLIFNYFIPPNLIECCREGAKGEWDTTWGPIPKIVKRTKVDF